MSKIYYLIVYYVDYMSQAGMGKMLIKLLFLLLIIEYVSIKGFY